MAVAQHTSSWRPRGRPIDAAGRLAIPLVLVVAISTWLLTGVSMLDAARYLAFEGLFVLLPGCMLYALLSGERKERLRMLAIGWPLGWAIEIGAFALTAALGRRELFQLLPVLAVLVLGPALLRSRGLSLAAALRQLASTRGRPRSEERGMPLLVGGCIVSAAAMVLLIEWFTRYPLPGHAATVAYFPDNVFDISIAADARHHWPIMEPYVAGQPLHYYTGFFIHAAAINQVTGVSIAAVVLRLFPTTVTLVIALQLWLLGSKLGRSRWAGTLAVALLFPVNDLSLDATKWEAFGTTPFYQLTFSPTYALGIPFFLGLLALIQRQLSRERTSLSRPTRSERIATLGSLLVCAILVLGGAAAKTIAIADFIGGLGAFCTWRLIRAKNWRLLDHLAVSVLCTAVVYHFMLSGGVSSIRIRPLDFMHFTLFVSLFPAHSPFQFAVLLAAALLTCFLLFVPALGAVWLLRDRHIAPFAIFSIAVFATALAAYTLLEAAGDAQLAFMNYGSIAIMPVAAAGLIRLWEETAPALRVKLAQACVIMLLFGLAIAASTRILIATASFLGWKDIAKVNWVWMIWYLVAYGLTACAVWLFSTRLERYHMPELRSRAVRIAACAIPLLISLGLVKSLGLALPELWDTLLSRQGTTDSSENRGMTAALYSGLLWVRAHTNPCDILAVNNHSISSREVDSKYFYYSAFTERRVFLESWAYTSSGTYGGQPFPARYALNELAVTHGNVGALQMLARKGVDYVLIDKLHDATGPEPRSVSTPVFDNEALEVYRLSAPGARTGRRAGCGIPLAS